MHVGLYLRNVLQDIPVGKKPSHGLDFRQLVLKGQQQLSGDRLQSSGLDSSSEGLVSVANFYAIFELYCPATRTFFTPVGELGMALHKMWEFSALPMGSLPYEEYFPCESELALLEK